MVTSVNNNKYYDMIETSAGIDVTYGRVGVTAIKKQYPSSKWHHLYSSKIKKGYKDCTDLHAIVKTSSKFATQLSRSGISFTKPKSSEEI